MFAHVRHVLSASTVSLWCISLMALLPFVMPFHSFLIPQFSQEWLTLLLGLVALYPLFNRVKEQPFAIPQIAFMFFGFGLIVIVQSMIGVLHSIQYALLLLAYMAVAFFVSILGGYLRRELGWEKLVTTIAWSILIGGLLNVAYVFLQYFSNLVIKLPFMANSGLGLIANLSHFSSYLALSIASLLYLYSKAHLKLSVFLIFLALLLSVLSLTMVDITWWQLALLTMLAIAIQIIAISQRTGSTSKRSLVRVALLILPMFVIIQWALSWFDIVSPVQIVASAAITNDWSARLHIWHESLLLFLRSPWLGVGIGQTHWMSFMTLDSEWSVNLPAVYENARNILLQVLAEMGVAGFLVMLASMFAWIRVFQWKRIDLEAWWLLAVLLLIVISSLFEAHLNFTCFLIITAFLLGAADEQTKSVRLTSKGVVASKAMLLGLVGLMIFALVNTLMANTKLENAYRASHSRVISSQEQANINQDLGWVKAHSLLATYADVVYAKSIVINEANIEDKLMINAAALRQMPTQQSAYRHVLFLEFNGQHNEAVAYMQRGVQAYPHQFKAELQEMPLQYWDKYLRIFSEAISPKPKQQ